MVLPFSRLLLTLLSVFAVALLPAQSGLTKRVQFARGHSSATVKGSVVRGTRDRYLVGARAGQVMTLRITSPERNAVLSVADPGGAFLKGAAEEDDATHWSGKLLSSGEYVIEVGGTRGNAAYSLFVAIK